MSTPEDEIPEEEDELEPDDWSEDSSLWGDEPIERPRVFADPDDEEPDEQIERPEADDPDDDEPVEGPRGFAGPDDEDVGPGESLEQLEESAADPIEQVEAPAVPDDAPSRSDEHPGPHNVLNEPEDPHPRSAAPLEPHGRPDDTTSEALSARLDDAPTDEHDLDEQTTAPALDADEHPAFDTQVEIDGATAPASKRPTPTEPRPTTPPVEVQVAALLADPSKRIVGDLHWSADEDGAQGREFLAPVRCAAGELRVRGQRCAAAGSLRFSLLSRGLGKIAALDLGHPHQTADGRQSGDTHFHRRDTSEQPTLPPLDPDDLAGAWRLFCALTNITHEGNLGDPAPVQETLL